LNGGTTQKIMQNRYKLILIAAAHTLANFVKGYTKFLSSGEQVTQDYWGQPVIKSAILKTN
jgi:hypothetical protein